MITVRVNAHYVLGFVPALRLLQSQIYADPAKALQKRLQMEVPHVYTRAERSHLHVMCPGVCYVRGYLQQDDREQKEERKKKGGGGGGGGRTKAGGEGEKNK